MSPDVCAARYILKKLCNHDNLSWPGPCFNIDLIKRLFVRSRKVSKPRDSYLELYRIARSLWNLTDTSEALLPICLSNFKAMRQFILPISRLRDFTRSYEDFLSDIERGPRAELHAQTRNTLHSASHEACCKSCDGDMEEYHSNFLISPTETHSNGSQHRELNTEQLPS